MEEGKNLAKVGRRGRGSGYEVYREAQFVAEEGKRKAGKTKLAARTGRRNLPGRG